MPSFNCRAPWSRISTLGEPTTGGSGALEVTPTEVTRILSAIDQGDPHAAAQLLPLVYDELRKLAAAKLAHEKPGPTLDATRTRPWGVSAAGWGDTSATANTFWLT